MVLVAMVEEEVLGRREVTTPGAPVGAPTAVVIVELPCGAKVLFVELEALVVALLDLRLLLLDFPLLPPLAPAADLRLGGGGG